MRKAILLAHPKQIERVYGPKQRQRLQALVDLKVFDGDYDDTDAVHAALADRELIFSTWSMKPLDEAFLAAAPKLQAVFYAAGSVRHFVTDAFWERDIPLFSAWAANAIPVAEMSFSLITLGLKRFFEHARRFTSPRNRGDRMRVPGAYGSKVGLIGLGMVGRRVRSLLSALEVEVLAYDPYLSAEDAKKLDVHPVDLAQLFGESDVVSLHAPKLPETYHMIKAEHFKNMKEGATFINTSRGSLVDESGMISVLRERDDITALLDVTDPEPPVEGSPLYDLPNVVLTPHIAGSRDDECMRMADFMIEECRRFLQGEALQYQVTRERFEHMA